MADGRYLEKWLHNYHLAMDAGIVAKFGKKFVVTAKNGIYEEKTLIQKCINDGGSCRLEIIMVSWPLEI